MLVPDLISRALLKLSLADLACVWLGTTQWFAVVGVNLPGTSCFGVAALKMSSPGATRSGLKRPSSVGPLLEKAAMLVEERRLPEATEQLPLEPHVV